MKEMDGEIERARERDISSTVEAQCKAFSIYMQLKNKKKKAFVCRAIMHGARTYVKTNT